MHLPACTAVHATGQTPAGSLPRAASNPGAAFAQVVPCSRLGERQRPRSGSRPGLPGPGCCRRGACSFRSSTGHRDPPRRYLRSPAVARQGSVVGCENVAGCPGPMAAREVLREHGTDRMPARPPARLSDRPRPLKICCLTAAGWTLWRAWICRQWRRCGMKTGSSHSPSFQHAARSPHLVISAGFLHAT